MFVIDAASGATRWTTQLEDTAIGVPTIHDGQVEVLAVHMPRRCEFDLAAVTLDAESGQVTGRSAMRPVPTFFYSSDPNVRAVAVDDARYTSMPVAELNTQVRIMATTNSAGDPIWEHILDGDGPAGLAVTPDVVVAAWPSIITDESKVPVTVAAFDTSSGQILWTTGVIANGGWADRRLGQHQDMYAPVQTARSSNLYGVAPIVPSHGLATVAVIGDRVFVPAADNQLVVLNLDDGQQLDEISNAAAPIAAAGGHLVVRRDDSLIALDAAGGEMWTVELPDWAPLVRITGTDTSVYVAVSGRYGGGPCPLD